MHSVKLAVMQACFIPAGAMVCSYFFERRLWCRHLCPIGGMNGMFAKLSMTELRAHTGICAGKHRGETPGSLPADRACPLTAAASIIAEFHGPLHSGMAW